MTEFQPQRLPSEHSAGDIWRAINTPLTGELGQLVNPYVVIECQGLSDEGAIQTGTLIVFTPKIAELRPRLGMAADALPGDVALHVKEHDPESRLRVDAVESDKHSGTVIHQVEEAGNGTGLLVIEGDITIGGSRKMFESIIASYAERGIAEHGQLVLSHLPAILGR